MWRGRRRRTSENVKPALTEFVAFLRLDSVRTLGFSSSSSITFDRTTWALKISCPVSGLATRNDRRCVLFVCPTSLAKSVLWPRSLSFFRRPELVCHHSVADHAHCWAHVCRPNDCRALAAKRSTIMSVLVRLLERWQRLPAVQQVFKHAVSNCEVSTPGMGASFSPLSMQVANTSSPYIFLQIARINGGRCRHGSLVLSIDKPPQTCSTVRTKQSDFVFFLPQMWVWTIPSDDERTRISWSSFSFV